MCAMCDIHVYALVARNSLSLHYCCNLFAVGLICTLTLHSMRRLVAVNVLHSSVNLGLPCHKSLATTRSGSYEKGVLVI